MNSESSKPTAGRVAEHSSWPAERRFAASQDVSGSGDLWDPGLRSDRAAVLRDILTAGRIRVPLAGTTREQVVDELVGLLVDAGDLVDGDEVVASILSREQTKSTGVGGGLAIPHARTSQVNDVVMAVGVCPKPVDFDSIDGAGAGLVVMLIGPEEMTAENIRALRRVTDMMSSGAIRTELLSAGSPEALYEIICRRESTA